MLAWLPPPWEWSGADWSGIQTAVLVAAGLIAFWQATEARRLRLERSRPFVILDIVVRESFAEFKVTNIGATLARDVQFHFEPPLRSTFDAKYTPLAELNVFTRGIPSLPPGKEIMLLFDQLPERLNTDLPDDYEVTISYRDPLGNDYTETMTVGYSHRKDIVYLTQRDLTDIYKQLETIAKETQKWSRSSSGIVMTTQRDLRRRYAISTLTHRARRAFFPMGAYYRVRLRLRRLW